FRRLRVAANPHRASLGGRGDPPIRRPPRLAERRTRRHRGVPRPLADRPTAGAGLPHGSRSGMTTTVGFDFGTTNSLVSVVSGDRVIDITDASGRPHPSVVRYEGERVIAG